MGKATPAAPRIAILCIRTDIGDGAAVIESRPGNVYNACFISAVRTIMEAEQLNIIANRLVDLAQRATELRRYL